VIARLREEFTAARRLRGEDQHIWIIKQSCGLDVKAGVKA
jgi:hypothetical protein